MSNSSYSKTIKHTVHTAKLHDAHKYKSIKKLKRNKTQCNTHRLKSTQSLTQTCKNSNLHSYTHGHKLTYNLTLSNFSPPKGYAELVSGMYSLHQLQFV